jgi:peptide/nickel transport system substrate-binding protein
VKRRAAQRKELALKHSSVTLAGLLIVAVLAGAPAAGTSKQTPKRGGTLVIAVPSSEPACLSVLSETCENPVADKVLESPFVIDRHFTFQPRLVSGVPFSRKPPFTLTYRIRPEARWSDGVPVTAQDFVFTLRAIRAHGSANARELHSVVRSIRAVDAKTVRVVLRAKSRRAGWRGLFPLVLPAHALRGEDLTKVWVDRMDNPKTGRPIGSGPFLVDHWERGKELVLRRNPNYWGPHPAYLDRIVVRFVESPSERLAAFEAGGIDVMQAVPPEAIPALRRRPGTAVSTTPGFGFEHFELRRGPGGRPALRNKLVRQALAYGIDRVAIVRQIWGEIDPGLRPLDSAVLLTQNRFYRANWSRYRFRPAQARRLLERAGCIRGGDGIYSCGGERLSLRFVTTAGLPMREQVLRLVQAQLLQAGVEVMPVFAAGGGFGPLVSGDFDAFLFSFAYSPDSTGIASVFGCGRDSNFSGYCQRLVTEELDESERILDEKQRARVLNRVDRQLAKDVPVIPLYPFVFSSARSKAVRGYVLHPSSTLWNAENWWLER